MTNTIRQGANSAATINYAYDDIGGLKKKTDFSIDSDTAYQYAPSTHKVSSVQTPGGMLTYGYDANGNVTNRNDSSPTSLQYDVSNLPRRISKNGLTSDFYDAPGGRYWQRMLNGTAIVRDTIHLDKTFEREVAQGVAKVERYYVAGQLMTISAAGRKLSYLHQDRLGSNVAISERALSPEGKLVAGVAVTIVEHRGFDAFGKALDGGWGTSNFGMLNLSGAQWNTEKRNQRGFTGHEHLDEFALIHMNGRAYDYNLGRFYGVDPFIQFPSNSQSLNPYGYLMNNPLSGTDPTGYACSTGTHIKGSDAIGCTIVQGLEPTASNSGRMGDRVVTEKGALRRIINASGVTEFVDYKTSSKANGASNNSATPRTSSDPSKIETATGAPAREKPFSVRVFNVIGDFLADVFEQGPKFGADFLGLTDGVEAIKAGVETATALSEGDSARALDSGTKAGGTLLTALFLGKVDKVGDAFRGFFRGAKPGETPSFTPRPSEFKVDASTGLVKETHGVSVFNNAESVTSKGFVPHLIDQNSIPGQLRIIQRGNDPLHFEIVPKPGANLTPQQFTNACNSILCVQ